MNAKLGTKNDIAWQKLFNKYEIIQRTKDGNLLEITSSQINEFREARLMTKFDHRSNLPSIFKHNNLAILPITRGSYVIGGFEAYHNFEKPTANSIKKVRLPKHIESIDGGNITSESTAINVAYLSGILADFANEEKLLPTVNGRMSSDSFEFNINAGIHGNSSISVVNSQLEIDGGYEGISSLSLIEAKNSISDDFLVRQLYYPFRLWQGKMEKEVKNIFLTYSNGLFSLYEYCFVEQGNYNSLTLVKQANYVLDDGEILLDDIVTIFKETEVTEEPESIPFPQADNFRRIVNICEIISEKGSLTKEFITNNYDFDTRQTNYYTAACRYLGLIKRTKEYEINFSLTDKGKRVFNLDLRERNLAFVKCIFEKEVFRKTFKKYLEYGVIPNKSTIIKIMRNSNMVRVGTESTLKRRASTVSRWMNWIENLFL